MMEVELQCEAEKCVFNLKELCTAPEIHINGGDTVGGRFTYCDTFSIDDHKASLKDLDKNTNYNTFTSNPEVGCSAHNCIYNEREQCNAPHVKIQSGIATVPIQTECETFFPREGQTS